jgi:hypothetical protein
MDDAASVLRPIRGVAMTSVAVVKIDGVALTPSVELAMADLHRVPNPAKNF